MNDEQLAAAVLKLTDQYGRGLMTREEYLEELNGIVREAWDPPNRFVPWTVQSALMDRVFESLTQADRRKWLEFERYSLATRRRLGV